MFDFSTTITELSFNPEALKVKLSFNGFLLNVNFKGISFSKDLILYLLNAERTVSSELTWTFILLTSYFLSNIKVQFSP